MPTSCVVYKRCTCQKCIKNGGRTEDGLPKGVLIAECLMAAHLQCTQRAQAKCVALTHMDGSTPVHGPEPEQPNPTSPSIPTLADDLEQLMLSDPSVAQPSGTCAHAPEHPECPNTTPVSIPALVDGLEQLTLSATLLHKTPKGAKITGPRENWRTMKDLKVLNNIELRIQQCLHSLLAGNSDDIHCELPLLHTAVEQVK
ncbi:uncharacterized protein BJ212DRAFT_1477752 [Suillus subaureus]|uniref:Uncharacterized protein n=1 Tax=Suillus subaureus TaxID=48587 RepID=A0A9P7JH30_9AGAM|nr:uncharacterized protein BJ212DRAFT_1477752 [Suillus subaureus]KAG1821920.1 hypothetical protein BJ212DRAFT_1477752 [Suillus subaureus]